MKKIKISSLIITVTMGALITAANPVPSIDNLLINARARAQATIDLLDQEKVNDLIYGLKQCNANKKAKNGEIDCPRIRREATALVEKLDKINDTGYAEVADFLNALNKLL